MYFFQGKYYGHVQGAAMGSPISPLITNLFMEEFEVKVLRTTPHPCLWLKFVDDIYVMQKAEHSQKCLHHINTQDPHIQFTMEEPNQDGWLPFLDTHIPPDPNNTLITTVYRKPTHTDQYLHWDSNHVIGAKYSVFNTLAHRAKVVSHNQQSLHKELDHIRKALQACQFPTWTLNRLQQKFPKVWTQAPNQQWTKFHGIQPNNNAGTISDINNKNISIMVPCIHGLGEKFKRTCNNKGIKVHLKAQTLLKHSLWHPRTTNCKRVG